MAAHALGERRLHATAECGDGRGTDAGALAYPKFKLSADEQHELLGDYLPFAEVVARLRRCPILCRDPGDQPFLDQTHSGGATVLVSGDADLLSLAGQTAFDIESPAAYRQRVLGR